MIKRKTFEWSQGYDDWWWPINSDGHKQHLKRVNTFPPGEKLGNFGFLKDWMTSRYWATIHECSIFATFDNSHLACRLHIDDDGYQIIDLVMRLEQTEQHLEIILQTDIAVKQMDARTPPRNAPAIGRWAWNWYELSVYNANSLSGFTLHFGNESLAVMYIRLQDM